MKRVVLVISGISGSGKSTLAHGLETYFRDRDREVCVLDGDMVRTFFEGRLGYEPEDRMMVSKILAFASALLVRHEVDVILATMLSQPGAREFLQSHVEFREVFLDADPATCARNDVKGVYGEHLERDRPNLVGHDLPMSRPAQPDLVIRTHEESPERSLQRITDFLSTAGYL